MARLRATREDADCRTAPERSARASGVVNGQASPHRSLGTAVALALLVAVFAVATMPWWRDGLVIPWDARNQFYPMLRWLANELHAGRLPQFMAEMFAGRPSLPDPQSMMTSPGFVLLAATDPAPSMSAMDFVVLVELLLGGMALMLLGRMFGIHPLACLMGSMVFVFGGAPMARLQHILLVQSYAFAPVVLLTIAFMARRPTLTRGLIAGVAVGLLATGRDHVSLLMLYLVAAFALVLMVRQPSPVTFVRRSLGPIAVAGATAAVIALPPILATAMMAGESNRPSFPAYVSGSGGMCPACLLTLPFGNLYDGLFDMAAYWGPGDRGFAWPNSSDSATVQYYAGVVPLVFALWGVLTLRSAGALHWFAAAIALAALLYGMGNWTPVFALLHGTVPGADLFRRASDAAFAFNLGLSLVVLCAAGRYVARDDTRFTPWHGIMIGIIFASFAVAAYYVAQRHGMAAAAFEDVAIAGALAAGAIALLIWGAQGSLQRRAVVLSASAALTAFDLTALSAGTVLNAQPPNGWQIQEDPLADPIMARLVNEVNGAEARLGPVRIEMLGFGGAAQNLPLIMGVENISGYNPIRSAAYDRATGSGQNSHLPKRRFGEQMTGYRSPLTDLLGVRFILLSAPMDEIDAASAGAFGPPIRIGDAYLYGNPAALPRALLVRADATQPLEPHIAAGGGPLPPFDWQVQALVADPARTSPDKALGNDGSHAAAGSLSIVAHGPGRLEAMIEPVADGYVVLHELRTAGWTAWVDGEQRDLLPANGLFQAVRVKPGDRRVVFRFDQWRAFSLP